MITYLIVFIFTCGCIHIGTQQKNKWNIFSIAGLLAPAVLAALRSADVGTDTVTYYTMSNLILESTLSFPDYIVRDQELLYYFVTHISTYVGGMWFVFFTYQFLAITFVYLTAWRFRKTIPVWIVIWLYFCLLFPYSLNIMRQITAVGFLMYVSTFLLNGNQKKFWIGAILGITIHATLIIAAVFIFALFFVAQRKKQSIFLWGLVYLVCIGIIYILFLKLVSVLNLIGISKLSSYGDATYVGDNGSYLSVTDVIFRLFFVIMIIVAVSSRLIGRRMAFIYFLLIITELMLLALGIYNQFLFRMALYLTAAHLIMLPYIANSKKLTRDSRVICKGIVVMIGFVYFWWIFVHNGTSQIVPYTMSV